MPVRLSQKRGERIWEGRAFMSPVWAVRKRCSGERDISGKNQFCIQYFPTEGEGKKEECNEIADRLFSCLEQITAVEELVRGTDMKYEAVNGSVCFYVNYDMFLYKGCDTLPRMEELTEKISAKGR